MKIKKWVESASVLTAFVLFSGSSFGASGDCDGILRPGPNRFWTAEKTVVALKHLNGLGLVSNPAALKEDPEGKTELALTRLFERSKPISGYALYKAIVREFGGDFRAAYLAAGLPEAWVGQRLKPRPLAVNWGLVEDSGFAALLKEAKATGHSLAAGALEKDRTESGVELVFKYTAKREPLSSVYFHLSRERYKNWTEALRALGFDSKAEASYRIWTATEWARALAGLYQLSPHALSTSELGEPTAEAMALVEQVRPGATPWALYRSLTYRYGSWPKALLAFGYSPEVIFKEPMVDWTNGQLRAAIHAVYLGEIPINSGGIKNDFSVKTQEVIEAATGRRVTGKRLYQKAVERFGSYPKFLYQMGFDPLEIQRRSPWKPLDWVRAIRALRQAGIEMKSTDKTVKELKLTRKTLKRSIGRSVGRSAVHRQLNLKGIQLEWGMRVSGFDPITQKELEGLIDEQLFFVAYVLQKEGLWNWSENVLRARCTGKTLARINEILNRMHFKNVSEFVDFVSVRFLSFENFIRQLRFGLHFVLDFDNGIRELPGAQEEAVERGDGEVWFANYIGGVSKPIGEEILWADWMAKVELLVDLEFTGLPREQKQKILLTLRAMAETGEANPGSIADYLNEVLFEVWSKKDIQKIIEMIRDSGALREFLNQSGD